MPLALSISSEEKQSAVGHCVVQSVRPRSVIAPIPFALGLSVDHVSGSKFLINVLHGLGLSVSYDEIYRYKHSVVQCDASAKPNPHLLPARRRPQGLVVIGVCLSVRTVFVRKISQERVHGSPPNLVGGSRA